MVPLIIHMVLAISLGLLASIVVLGIMICVDVFEMREILRERRKITQ